MIKKMWLPAIATIILLSLVFIENIPVQSSDAFHTDSEEIMLSNLAGKYSIDLTGNYSGEVEESTLEFFDQFLSNLGPEPFTNEKITFADTTGDGRKEKIRYAYRIVNDQCFIEQEIFKNNACIWRQELTLTANHVKLFFTQKVLRDDLYNYALCYLASRLSPFTDKLEVNSEFTHRIKHMVLNAPENKGMSPKEAYKSDLMKEFQSYKGMYVFRREPGHEAVYMWDETIQTFKKIYSLQSFSA